MASPTSEVLAVPPSGGKGGVFHQQLLNAVDQACAPIFMSEEVRHLRSRPDGCQRIENAFAGDDRNFIGIHGKMPPSKYCFQYSIQIDGCK